MIISLESPYTPGTVKKFGGIEFVFVPKGEFLMGSKDDNPLAFDNEKPQHTVEIPYDYWISRYPVTNGQFFQFIQAARHVTTAEKEGGWSPDERAYVKGVDWRHPLSPKSDLKGKDDHPVVQVSWYDAIEYCKWLNQAVRGEVGDLVVRLPTEAEWEKAARGAHGNEWPWGNEFDTNKCNSDEASKGGTTPVGAYSPQGDSPYGAADMVGNVWEWTQSLWGKSRDKPDFKYPYNSKDGRENLEASSDVLRVVRGGSFFDSQRYAHATYRYGLTPLYRNRNRGFRLGVAPRLS